MQIEIGDDVAQKIQSLTTLKLVGRDYEFFTDWLIVLGVDTVKATLHKYPDLTVGEIAMLQFKRDFH